MTIPLSLNQLTTAVLVIDQHGSVIYLNESCEQLLGYSGRQIIGELIFDLIHTPTGQLGITPELIRQFGEEGQSGLLEEVDIKTNSGLINANILISNFLYHNQTHILLEMQNNEQHAHIRKDIQLQHQSRVSTSLIRNLAHEIKNPLGGIKGAAQLLERKLPADFSDKYCQIIITEADRLSALVGKLLLPAVPETPQLTNIHLLIEKAIELVQLQSDFKINIRKDYDPSIPECEVSPGQIQQCLLNLIKNASEAITQDQQIIIRSRIVHQHTIGKEQFKQVIRVDIVDNGCGIPASIINDIFFPTISGKNSSGLGLSIAQSLAQRHGGIIEVESEPSQTIFSLYLPLGIISGEKTPNKK